MEVYARLLGAPQLRLADASIEPPLTKATLLLYYLAYKGEWCSRDELVYLFYPESSESNARSNLRQRLTSLRRLPYTQDLEIEAARLRWPVETDVQLFKQAAGEGNHARATDLYGGQLLEGCTLPDAPEFEDWLLGEREDLHSQWRDLVFSYTPSLEAAQPEEASNLLRTVLKYDPLDEEALRAYMLAAAHAGQKSVALRAYKSFSTTLQDELDLEPTSATQQLAAAIEKGEVAAVARTAKPPTGTDAKVQRRVSSLPATTTSFMGREKEITQVTQLLEQENCRLLTILAAGGMGKTRLALQVLSSLTDAYPDGCAFVALDAITSPEAAAGAIATSLGTELRGQVEPLVQVATFIGHKTMLLALDNFEHLLEAATIASELIQRCPNLKLLITSRERLNLAEEWLLQLGGLTYPERYTDAETALASDAVALFSQRATQVRPGFTPDDEDLRHIVAVCGLVEGSPLAIELAAVWARVMPPSEIVAELINGIDFLTVPTRNIPERHRSLRATFEHSWRLLTPLEQDVLRKLSVFVGGFRREAASVVAGAPIAVLAALVDKSLLRVTPEGRYDQHPLLRQYTCEKLAEQPNVEEELQRKCSGYFIRFLGRKNDEAGREYQREALRAIDAELANILEAAQRALASGGELEFVTMMRLLVVHCAYYDARGCDNHALGLIHQAAEVVETKGDLETAHYLFTKLGNIYREFRGDLNQALEAYRRALALAKKQSNTHRQVVLLSLVGMVRFLQNESDSQAYLEEADSLSISTCDDLARSHLLQNRSYIAFHNRNWHEMHHLCTEAVKLLGNLRQEPSVNRGVVNHLLFFSLLNLGEAERKIGHFQTALQHRQQALELAKQQDNQLWTAYAYQEIGEMYHDTKDYQRAKTLFLEALHLYRKNEALVDARNLERLMDEGSYYKQA